MTINIIRRYIWRWAKWDCLTHDAFHCSKFSRTKPFPTRREIHPNNFVGAVGWSMFYVNFIVCISGCYQCGDIRALYSFAAVRRLDTVCDLSD